MKTLSMTSLLATPLMALLLAALALPAAAQTAAPAPARGPIPPVPQAVAAAAMGNVQAGQQLATAGTTNGVTACVGCHGAQGEGNAAGGFPRIGGQSAYYLAKQLGAYANGARVNPIMQPIAKAMNIQQMRDAGAYYATLGGGGGAAGAAGGAAASPAAAAPKGNPARGGSPQQRAQQLSSVGDESKGVQACANCHGPGGMGQPPAYPYLAGQHANYLTATMTEWRNGARKTDNSGQMPHIAKQLDDADVAALSAYFSAQPAPPPAAKMVNIAAGSVLRPAVAAQAGGPKGAPTGVSGAGSEQGAPLTGGNQGPGGGGGTKDTNPGAPAGQGSATSQGNQPAPSPPPPPPARK
jgi:cytochrome c553